MSVPLAYLSEVLAGPFGTECRILRARRHEGPRGKRIIFLNVEGSSGDSVGLVLKIFGEKAEHDNERRGLRVAAQAGVLAPTAYAQSGSCDNPLGAPFVVMSHLSGHELTRDGRPAPELLTGLRSDLARLYSMSGTPNRRGSPRVAPDRLDACAAKCVSVLESSGESSSACLLRQLLEDLTAWRETHGTMLAESPWRYVHGDLYPGNLLVTDSGRIGFLDWAGSAWGDAAEDLAYLTVRTLPWMVDDVRETGAALVEHLARHLRDHTLPDRCRYYQAVFVVQTCYLALEQWAREDVVERVLAKCIPELT